MMPNLDHQDLVRARLEAHSNARAYPQAGDDGVFRGDEGRLTASPNGLPFTTSPFSAEMIFHSAWKCSGAHNRSARDRHAAIGQRRSKPFRSVNMNVSEVIFERWSDLRLSGLEYVAESLVFSIPALGLAWLADQYDGARRRR